MNKKSLRLGFAALVATGAAMALVTPAASAAPGGCTTGRLCVYYDVNYNRGPALFNASNTSWAGFAIEDDDSSWFNNRTTSAGARVYDNRGYGGSSKCFDAGNGDRSAIAVDDRGSSNQFVSGC